MAKLNAEVLYKSCNPDQFNFETTEEISESTTIIGQERLASSLAFGTGMKDSGFNIFALGPNKTNKRDHLKQFFEQQSADEKTPSDLCYINNFEDRYKPQVMRLPAGRGCNLQKQMDQLIENLVPALTSAFETEEYQNRRQSLQEQIQQEQGQSFEDLQEKAKEKGLAMVRTPAGFSMVPLKEDGEMMDEQEVKDLSEDEHEELEEKTRELQEELQKLIRKMPARQRKVRERLKKLDQEIATYAIDDLFDEVRENFTDLEQVQDFLDKVEADIIENVQSIAGSQGQQQGQGGNQLAQMAGGQQSRPSDNPLLESYRVNVLVDNRDTEGAPVIYEDNPSYKNLVGRVEY